MLALMRLCGIGFNPLDVMALPVVLGIAVDDGVHLVHRFLAESGGPGAHPGRDRPQRRADLADQPRGLRRPGLHPPPRPRLVRRRPCLGVGAALLRRCCCCPLLVASSAAGRGGGRPCTRATVDGVLVGRVRACTADAARRLGRARTPQAQPPSPSSRRSPPRQLAFQPSPGAWSLTEVADHLTLIESNVGAGAARRGCPKTAAGPPSPSAWCSRCSAWRYACRCASRSPPSGWRRGPGAASRRSARSGPRRAAASPRSSRRWTPRAWNGRRCSIRSRVR